MKFISYLKGKLKTYLVSLTAVFEYNSIATIN